MSCSGYDEESCRGSYTADVKCGRAADDSVHFISFLKKFCKVRAVPTGDVSRRTFHYFHRWKLWKDKRRCSADRIGRKIGKQSTQLRFLLPCLMGHISASCWSSCQSHFSGNLSTRVSCRRRELQSEVNNLGTDLRKSLIV
jgi:hypothetical protein